VLLSTGNKQGDNNPLSSMIVILVLISALAGGLYLVMQYFKKKTSKQNSVQPDKGDDVLPLPPPTESQEQDGAENNIPKTPELPEPVIAFDETEQ